MTILLLVLTLAAAQEPRFEAASGRPNTSGDQRISMGTRGKTYTATADCNCRWSSSSQ